MFMVLTYRDRYFDSLEYVGPDRSEAEKHFFDACEAKVSNWDEYPPHYRDEALDNGNVTFGNGSSITLIDTTNCVSDTDLIHKLLSRQPEDNASDILDKYAEKQGWNDTARLSLLTEYLNKISGRGSGRATFFQEFSNYLSRLAYEENLPADNRPTTTP